MFVHPHFDPFAIRFGETFGVRWYGLMYLAGFVAGLLLGRARAAAQPWHGYTRRDVEDMLFYSVLGIVIGGRLGYVLFYKPGYYLQHPLEVFAIWAGGMSFHGGFLGVLAAMAWFAARRGKSWLALMDFVAPLVPTGIAAGRLGNFINAELWGRPTDLPWAMIFPQVDRIGRHPSQLYEFALEGVALFVLLWWYSRKQRPAGSVSGLFLAGYGVFRFAVEYTREPDSFIGALPLGFTMGQWLSLPMLLAGVALFVWSRRRASDG